MRVGVALGLRTVKEAINVLLPVAAIGGDIVRARLLNLRGVAGGVAVASASVDLLLEVAAQALFALIGVALLTQVAGGAEIVSCAAAGLGIGAFALGGFYAVQRLGGAIIVERALSALARRWPAAALGSGIRLHASLQAIYADRPAILVAFSLHELAWLLGAVETWIALWLIGVPVSPIEATLLCGLWAGIPHGRSCGSTDCGGQAAPLLGKRLIDMDEGYVIGDWTAAAPAPLEEVIVGRLDGSQAGIRWLRRHLGDRGLRLHELESRCARPMHIDTTFVPLAPGKVLVNPDFIDVDRLPPILKRWDVLIAPRSDPVDGLMAKFSMCSPWTSINVLMLDHRRVVAEASQPTLHRALKDWGFEPLPLPFVAYGPFGGAFHCATLDTRRRGALEDYF